MLSWGKCCAAAVMLVAGLSGIGAEGQTAHAQQVGQEASSMPASGSTQAVDEAALEHGKTLFLTGAAPACAICHTLADAGAAGTIGPDLDELKPSAEQVKKALKEGVGAMPSFAKTLSAADMDAVAAYVVQATGGAQ